MDDDDIAAVVVMLADLDPSRQDDQQAVTDLADADQRFAVGKGHLLPEPPQPLDLRRRQDGESLGGARLDDRRRGFRHGPIQPAIAATSSGSSTMDGLSSIGASTGI